jgi:hypothetical protein
MKFKYSNAVLGLLLAVFVCTSFNYADKKTKFYEEGWYALLAMPQLLERCLRGDNHKIFDEAAKQYAGFEKYLYSDSQMDNQSYDFGLSVFAFWTLSGVCRIQAAPGSPYENVPPGP